MKYFKQLFLALAFLFTFSLNQNALADFGDTVKLDSSTRIDIGDYFNYVQRGMPFYGGTSTGAANIYALNFSEAPSTFVAGQRYYFLAHQTNAGNVTIQVGVTTKSLRLIDGSTQVLASTITSGDVVEIFYDGTNFRLVSANKATSQIQALQTAVPALQTAVPPVQTAVADVRTGWVAAPEAWTYASATTINIPSGGTARYQLGDKIWITNSGTKYFYVTGVTSTLLTVTGGSDYSVANAAISAIYYSTAAGPFGFPQWFNYTSTYTGFSANPTNLSKFQVNGRVVTFVTQNTAAGTSNAASYSQSLPITSFALTNFGYRTFGTGTDNGGYAANVFITLGQASSSVSGTLNGGLANFTAANGKSASFTIVYGM